jgi:lipid-binding SYLF domain-containing protein
MKKLSFLLIVALIFGIANVSIAANAEDYSSTINVFRDSPVVAKFFKNSYGYAVFPTIGKGAYIVGGSYGEGQVYKRGKVTGKTTVIEGSIGFQAGGEAFSEIIFFKDKRAYDAFTSGKFEFNATAQAVAITAGAEAQVATTGATAGATGGPRTSAHAKTSYANGMATFVHAKGGLMIGVSIGGQKFTFERK